MRILLCTVLLCSACASAGDHSMASEAYAQRYSTASSTGSRSSYTSSGAAGLLSAILIIPAICNQIDSAKNRREKAAGCNNLLRHLDTNNAAAYEWQSYFVRCKP